jgi:uncharacterized membrane protein YgdD (TMEM256/DUF423 family)
MDKIFVTVAGVLGVLAVAAGTIGAHVLKDRIEPRMLEVFETATQYHIYHTLALLAAAALATRFGGKLWNAACLFFILGIVLFCGSLYLYAGLNVHDMAHVAPFGGFSLMIGWLLLAIGAAVKK